MTRQKAQNINLVNGVRIYQKLPSKRERDRDQFDKNNAETFRIFGSNGEKKRCLNRMTN